MNSEQEALEIFLKLPENIKEILVKHNAFRRGSVNTTSFELL